MEARKIYANNHMMKKILFILLLLNSFVLQAQLINYKGCWINTHNEAIIIKDSMYYNNYLINKEKEKMFYVSSKLDTLRFYNNHLSKHENYDFKVIKKTDSLLILKPANKQSKMFFKAKGMISLVKQKYFADKTLEFEKLIFHTTYCHGSCPTYHLEIDSNKNVRLFSQEVLKKYLVLDTSKMGFFIGNISSLQYAELVKKLGPSLFAHYNLMKYIVVMLQLLLLLCISMEKEENLNLCNLLLLLKI